MPDLVPTTKYPAPAVVAPLALHEWTLDILSAVI